VSRGGHTLGTVLRFDDPLPRRPSRVLVAGVSGVGKTTLAARVSQALGIPHTEIDALFHGPGWVPRPQFVDDVGRLASSETWVTEWQYSSAKPILAARAELLVWLDLPFLRVTLPRVVRRTLHRRRRREVLWNGNVEPPLRTVFTDREHIVRWAWTTRRAFRIQVPELESSDPHIVIVRLRSPRQVGEWLSGPLGDAADRPAVP
jgi:adenylate kinase family enzyme